MTATTETKFQNRSTSDLTRLIEQDVSRRSVLERGVGIGAFALVASTLASVLATSAKAPMPTPRSRTDRRETSCSIRRVRSEVERFWNFVSVVAVIKKSGGLQEWRAGMNYSCYVIKRSQCGGRIFNVNRCRLLSGGRNLTFPVKPTSIL